MFLPAGNVIVGRVYQRGEYERIEHGYVIRRWNTTDGIGQLRKGPLDATILDYFGRADWHILQRFIGFECSEAGWAPWLSEAGAEKRKELQK